MSDTSAPAAPAPTNNAPSVNPSPPARSEIPINPNPTSSPNPLGPQTPDRLSDPGAERRAAIQRAFDRADKTEQAPARRSAPVRDTPKPAEARAGHNQPPEETPKEKFDLRKRPPADDQPRDRGRFAPRQRENLSEVNQTSQRSAGQTGQTGQTGQDAEPWRKLPETTPYRQPPERMAARAKSEWHAAPESVRGEVHRMQEEFVKAYRVYKNDFDEMSKIRHFHKMAADHGTDLKTALTNYTGMEAKLRADPVAGLDLIVNNLNLRSPDNQKLTFRDIAYHVLSQSPDQIKQLQMGNQQEAANHQIGALHQEIQGLKSSLHQMHNQQQFNYTRSAVDVFAESHPRFDELGTLIEQELKFGFDLETAYRRAEMLRPNPAPQTRSPSAQTRPPDRSISGAYDAGPSNGTSRRPREPSPTARAAVTNAIKRLSGGI